MMMNTSCIKKMKSSPFNPSKKRIYYFLTNLRTSSNFFKVLFSLRTKKKLFESLIKGKILFLLKEASILAFKEYKIFLLIDNWKKMLFYIVKNKEIHHIKTSVIQIP